MRWFWNFYRLRVKQIAQELTLWILLLSTVILSMVPVISFANDAGNEIRIAVINEDEGSFSDDFLDAIQEINGFTYLEQEDLAAAQKALSTGRLEAVVVIPAHFSAQITALDFSDTFSFYVSPTTSIGSLLAELFSEKVIELWAREVLLADFLAFREEYGQPVNDELTAELRREMEAASLGEPLLIAEYHFIEEAQTMVDAAQPTAEEVVGSSLLWFSAAVIFFILLSSTWMVEQRRTAIGERMHSLGVNPAVAALSSALAVVTYCSLAAALTLLLSRCWLPISVGTALKFWWILNLYFVSAVGIAVLISAFLRSGVDLMIIAPMFTMANAILGGLFTPLPAWAGILEKISYAFPGRLLNQAVLSGQWGQLGLYSLLVFGVGMALAAAITGKGVHDLE